MFLIRAYQRSVSVCLPSRCRFYPTCSQFALISLDKFPTTQALWKITARLSRCHPWHPGGIDYP